MGRTPFVNAHSPAEALAAAIVGGVVGWLFFQSLTRRAWQVVKIQQAGKLSSRVRIEAVLLESLPGYVQEFFGDGAPVLAAADFSTLFHAKAVGDLGEVTYYAVWENRGTGDSATLALTAPAAAGASGNPWPWVCFETRFADGKLIRTVRWSHRLLDPEPSECVLVCPHVEALDLLLNAHRRWVEVTHPAGERGILLPHGVGVAELQRGTDAERDQLVRLGIYRRAEPGVLRLTWKGALLTARSIRPEAFAAEAREGARQLGMIGLWGDGTPRLREVGTARPHGRGFDVTLIPVANRTERPPVPVIPVDVPGAAER